MPTVSRGSLPHVMLIMEENQGYAATLGDCSADRYICSLASKYASASNWYGVSHPSLPNYLAVTSGSTLGCASDSCGTYSGDNLGNQLSLAGIPWTGYMESMPSACYTGSSSGEYAAKHNPFVHYGDVLGSTCARHVLPYPGPSGLVSALDGVSAPDFVWITPNLIDDMHDGTIADGNSWLQTNLAPVLASAWFTGYRSTVIVTMDENGAESSGGCCGSALGGQIPEIIISRNAVGRGKVSASGDHYGTLRTIEEAYALPLLGAAAHSANGDLSSLFG
ncbi:MAG TPA: alkaline phosphatase family protein [Candidatus Dormibacteraeota bacterium]|nr:alkaline phosphatase family protein [Candidatus Dormibacteraeota bacterium]